MLGFQWDAVLRRWSRKAPFWPPWPYCSVQGLAPAVPPCASLKYCFAFQKCCLSSFLKILHLHSSCCVVFLQNASQYSSRLFLLLVLSGLTQVILFFVFPSSLSPVFYWISPTDPCGPCACNSVSSAFPGAWQDCCECLAFQYLVPSCAKTSSLTL